MCRIISSYVLTYVSNHSFLLLCIYIHNNFFSIKTNILVTRLQKKILKKGEVVLCLWKSKRKPVAFLLNLLKYELRNGMGYLFFFLQFFLFSFSVSTVTITILSIWYHQLYFSNSVIRQCCHTCLKCACSY